ncbi:unnamed protein product [Paramecium sonneborni]|uniref:Uncharacterized protein n=1 Tax=Paramecium sonneborni TaxID=65129 RepID=A0A8S1R9K3_9CILI|nr:unnamed protein product [Paramecium sonneborni]
MNKTLKFNRRQQSSEQMGFCIQCNSFIAITQIDSHCLNCMENKRNIQCCSDNISFQLKQINKIAENGIAKCEQGSEKLKFLIRIKELCNQIESIKCYNILSIKKLKDLKSEVEVLVSYPQLSVTILMLFTRLESLLKEKLELQNKRKLIIYDSARQNVTARIQTEQVDNEDTIYNQKSLSFENELKQQLEFKRNFYSKCLEMKVKLPKSHPAQQILVLDLYKYVIRQKYNLEQAQKFIQKCFRGYDQNQV